MKIINFEKRLLYLSFLLIQITWVQQSFAATFTVSNASEFQTALNDAAMNNEDDIIIVLGGTYNLSSSLVFWSDENHSLSISGEESPVLNGGDNIRVMEIVSVAENADINIDGITIEHGNTDYGGGLYVETDLADIHLNNCVFKDNTGSVICGGANCYSNGGNIDVVACTFLRNSSPNTSGYPNGTAGGLFIQTENLGSQITLTACFFEENTAQRDGGGAMLYPLGNGSSVMVSNNTFENNTSIEFGGGCWIRCPGGDADVQYVNNTLSNNAAAESGSGGGTYIEIETGSISLSDNIHIDNSASWQGGGLWINHNGGSLNLHNNSFSGNISYQNGGAVNIYLESGEATINKNLFYNNIAQESGGGLNFATTSAAVDVFNNTFYSNDAPDGSDTYFYFDASSSSCDFFNNILYQSPIPSLSYSGQQTVTALYSDIQNGEGQPWFGTGCIDEDPLFVDAGNNDFHLGWENFPVQDETQSPCIDSGDPSSAQDADGSIADMGAFYFDQDTGSSMEDNYNDGNDNILLSLYPNPFHDNLKMDLNLKNAKSLSIVVINVWGEEVFTIDNIADGLSKQFVWDAKDMHGHALPGGIYFIYVIVDGKKLCGEEIIKK